MYSLVALALCVYQSAAAHHQSTGAAAPESIVSLWIPYQTVTGTPLATIVSINPTADETVYALSCPTAEPKCPISAGLTLTDGVLSEGSAYVEYTTMNPAGEAVVGCRIADHSAAICTEHVSGRDEVLEKVTTVPPSNILYQAVHVMTASAATETFIALNGTNGTVYQMPEPVRSMNVAGGLASQWMAAVAIGTGLMVVAAL